MVSLRPSVVCLLRDLPQEAFTTRFLHPYWTRSSPKAPPTPPKTSPVTHTRLHPSRAPREEREAHTACQSSWCCLHNVLHSISHESACPHAMRAVAVSHASAYHVCHCSKSPTHMHCVPFPSRIVRKNHINSRHFDRVP